MKIVAKYVIATIALGVIGKAMLVGAKDGADLPTVYAQFVPVLPMLMLNFKAHKHIWGHSDSTIGSFVGKKWTRAYAVNFVGGHAAFSVFAVWLGMHYLTVSVAIGGVSMIVMYLWNHRDVFNREKRTAIP